MGAEVADLPPPDVLYSPDSHPFPWNLPTRNSTLSHSPLQSPIEVQAYSKANPRKRTLTEGTRLRPPSVHRR
ncbi:hypothetical protein L804_00062 [Cryptococcus deuterogattii 2001/935-1]|nr:hypothetical protein L804_00062 [Cryptococcus deuterogattii 2001/935-1]